MLHLYVEIIKFRKSNTLIIMFKRKLTELLQSLVKMLAHGFQFIIMENSDGTPRVELPFVFIVFMF